MNFYKLILLFIILNIYSNNLIKSDAVSITYNGSTQRQLQTKINNKRCYVIVKELRSGTVKRMTYFDFKSNYTGLKLVYSNRYTKFDLYVKSTYINKRNKYNTTTVHVQNENYFIKVNNCG
jgi:hypothetical protein